jgi:hypothetical protein
MAYYLIVSSAQMPEQYGKGYVMGFNLFCILADCCLYARFENSRRLVMINR